ncbi:MAG: autotransporter-associated beta strand repeat-containing protein [Breznakibacter sp.]
MKKFTNVALSVFLLIAALPDVKGQQLAFPGAEGFGKYAVGGRYGSVYRVTNLNDSGTGSLRDAVSQSNRIVVFDVAGVIKINSVLVFSANLYIAGQTAPGEGITVYGNRVSFSGANNTICRYMKFRMGSVYGDSGKDACGISNGKDIIFDHVSVSWGRDETFSVSWDSKGTEPSNITIQNSIIAQGLMSHSAGGLIQTNGGVTLYRNLYVDNDTRNNKIKGVNQYVNNIVYNWKSAAYIMGGDSEGTSYANCEGNLFIKGPANGDTPLSGANSNFNIYAQDNWYDNNKNGTLDPYLVPYSEYSGGPTFVGQSYNYPTLPTVPATALTEALLPTVGASLPCRDYVDYYVVNEVESFGVSGFIITSEDELPFGIPLSWSLWSGVKRTDTDGDGMPDEWEDANGLDKNSATDAMQIAANGYANIENYINGIDASFTQDYLRTPLNFRLAEATPNSVTLAWYDYTEKEDGYLIERLVDGVYAEIGRVGVNVSSFKVEGLQPEEQGSYRVKAYSASLQSDYSNVLVCKSKPIPVDVIDPATYVPDVVWSGAVNGNWDLFSENWLNPNVVAFADDDKVMFGNQASSQIINIAETVSPLVTFVMADNDYTFSGTGAIAGTGSVNKTGNGKLLLLTDNVYTGATVVHSGTLEVNKLANGGAASSVGASQNYDFNWVWKGGKISYTGSSVSTDRNVALEETSEFAVVNSASVVSFTGHIGGEGGLIKNGPGKLVLPTQNPFAGPLTVSEGIVDVSVSGENGSVAVSGFGTSGKVNLNGGTLKTSNGSTSNYETYTFDIYVEDGTTSGFEPYRNCYIKSKVSGSGNLNFNIYYVREYLQGDWSQFSGTLYANGLGTTSDGNQLLINNTNGIPNGRIVTSGTTKIVSWVNAKTLYLGGLSGPSGTYLAGGDKQNNSATCTWIVGGAGTDETFNGIINNECSNKNYGGTTTIVKEGAGVWRLAGNNIYKGTTTVTGGTLIVNGTHTGTGAVTVRDEAVLGGKGTMPGAVTMQSGSTLQPGDFGIGTFKVASVTFQSGSTLEMDINKTLNTFDKLAVTNAAVLGGTLKVNVTGTLVAGNSFAIITAGNFSGSFAAIEPAIPGEGLAWSFTDGVLNVIGATTPVTDKLGEAVIRVGPNPVKTQLTMWVPQMYKNLDLKVSDLTGRHVIVQTSTNTGSGIDIDFTTLPKGIYLVSVVGDGIQLPIQKAVKE